jgi:hypothetical protein
VITRSRFPGLLLQQNEILLMCAMKVDTSTIMGRIFAILLVLVWMLQVPPLYNIAPASSKMERKESRVSTCCFQVLCCHDEIYLWMSAMSVEQTLFCATDFCAATPGVVVCCSPTPYDYCWHRLARGRSTAVV